jgi:hypothetical protein
VANVSVTYTFSNGTVADATEVNQNFTDVINGLSDGTKDISIAALTVAGTATLNGAVNLGNATGDDLTFTGLAASDFKPKTDATYYLGSSSLGWLGAYLGRNSNRVLLQNNASASASWTFTFPVNAGVAGQSLVNQGSGTQAWKYNCIDTAAKSADYTVTDTDMIKVVLMTTGASDRTVTLPTAADNPGRVLVCKKVDSGAGKLIIDGEGSETIDGALTNTIASQYGYIKIVCDGTNWHIEECRDYISASIAVGSAVALSTGTSANVVSLSLPPGIWVASGNVTGTGSSGVITRVSLGINSTSATLPSTGSGSLQQWQMASGIWNVSTANCDWFIPTGAPIALTTATTYYMVANCAFASGTVSVYGKLYFLRIG